MQSVYSLAFPSLTLPSHLHIEQLLGTRGPSSLHQTILSALLNMPHPFILRSELKSHGMQVVIFHHSKGFLYLKLFSRVLGKTNLGRFFEKAQNSAQIIL